MGNRSDHDSSMYDSNISNMVVGQTKHTKIFNRQTTNKCYLQLKARLLLDFRNISNSALNMGSNIDCLLNGGRQPFLSVAKRKYCNTFNGDFLLCWTIRFFKCVWKIKFQTISSYKLWHISYNICSFSSLV